MKLTVVDASYDILSCFLKLTFITLASRSKRFICELKAPPPCLLHLSTLVLDVTFRIPTVKDKHEARFKRTRQAEFAHTRYATH